MSSGDDVETGRTKSGESTTAIEGGRPSELDVPFNGTVVFTAGARTDAQRPDTPVCGVRGVGWNGFGGPLNSVPTPGGCGVIGWGAENRGTGVIGFGGGARHQGPFITWTVGPDGPEGSGGESVLGRGGDGHRMANTSSSIGPFSFSGPVAGAGVVGRGGTSRVPATEVPNPGGRSAGRTVPASSASPAARTRPPFPPRPRRAASACSAKAPRRASRSSTSPSACRIRAPA